MAACYLRRQPCTRAARCGLSLAQVSAHNAADFCIYYENAVLSSGDEPHPVHPPIFAIGVGPRFHPRCVHVLTAFVERLATEEKKKARVVSPEVLDRTPAELRRRYRTEQRLLGGKTTY
jgi:hypothetical protein